MSISPTARRQLDAPASKNAEVVLMHITHPDIDKVIRLSSIQSEMVQLKPYLGGTYSTWLTPNGEPFLFVGMKPEVPGNKPDEIKEGGFIMDIPDSEVADLLTQTIHPATVNVAVVMRRSPNHVEQQFLGMDLSSTEGDGGTIVFRFNQKNLLGERVPADRMTKQRVPGLHR